MESWLRVRGSSCEVSLSAGDWDVWRRGRGFDLGSLIASVAVGSSHLNRDLVSSGARLILEPVGAEASELSKTMVYAVGGSWSNRESGSPEVVSDQFLQYYGVPPGRC